MKDRNTESLSALMDGEADELEIRRILNQLDKDDELRSKWKNYHLVGSLMREESFDSIDLTQGINQALDGVVDPVSHDAPLLKEQDTASVAKPAWYKPLTSVAVAASVTLAVLVGVQSIEPDNGVGLASNISEAPAAELTASTLSFEEQQKLEEAQQQLQEYVLQQPSIDGEVGSKGQLPFARVVEFQSKDK
jgi:sigma-E factor negative regulatory protein RseA